MLKRKEVQIAEKKQVTIILLNMGMTSTELKVKLHRTFKQLLPLCSLRVIFKISSRMKNYFKGKIKRELHLYSFLVSHEALIILQRTAKRAHPKKILPVYLKQQVGNKYIIFVQKYYNSTTLSMWYVYTYVCL